MNTLAALIFIIVVGLIIVGIAVGYMVEKNKMLVILPGNKSQVSSSTNRGGNMVEGAMYIEEPESAATAYLHGSKGSYSFNPFV